jgi:hypothetical protein
LTLDKSVLAAAMEMLVGGVVLLAVGAGSGELSHRQYLHRLGRGASRHPLRLGR